jgi:hypothetical protein
MPAVRGRVIRGNLRPARDRTRAAWIEEPDGWTTAGRAASSACRAGLPGCAREPASGAQSQPLSAVLTAFSNLRLRRARTHGEPEGALGARFATTSHAAAPTNPRRAHA